MGNATVEQKMSTESLTSMNVSQETISEINDTCNVANTGSNIVQIIGSRVKGLNVKQKNAIKALCKIQALIKIEQNAETTNKILNDLAADAKAQAQILSGGAKTSQDIKTNTKSFMNIDLKTRNKTVQDCIMKQNMSNVVQIIGSDVSDSGIEQVNDSIGECIMGSEAFQAQKSETSSDTSTEVKAKAEAKSTSMEMSASIAGAVMSYFILCSVVVFFVYYSLGGEGGGVEAAKAGAQIYMGIPPV